MSKKRSRLWMLALIGTLVPAGCLRIEQASPLRLGSDAADPPERESAPHARDSIWPARWSADPTIRGAIVPLDGTLGDWYGVRLGEDHYLRSTPADQADAEAVARIAGTTTGYQYTLEGPGCFIFKRADPDFKGRMTSSKPAELFKFVSARPLGKSAGIESVLIERTWMAYYDPDPAVERRGLIVLCPGLFGVPEPVNDRFTELCQRDGWAVLRLLAPPSRFTERTRFPVRQDDLDAAAKRLADELGQRAAEVAYAVQAGVQHVHTLRPDLADESHVLVGMSGGAMAGPTVYALQPDTFDAVVLIGGGSNFLLINEYSNYSSWVRAIMLDFQGPAPRGEERAQLMAELSNRYLEHAPLDGFHLAAMLHDKPVLMLQGSNDQAVPSRYGDQLWERLGKPERWMFQAGHELLFLTLNGYTPQILRWLDEHVQVDP